MTGDHILKLQGGFHLEETSGERPGRKLQAVLAKLALMRGRPVPRDVLAAMFWGDRQDEQARQSVRQALSGLRRALGPGRAKAIVVVDDAVCLDREVLSCDAEALRRALDDDDTVAALTDQQRPAGKVGQALTTNQSRQARLARRIRSGAYEET